MALNTFYLERTEYSEERREVEVKFRGMGKSRFRKFAFFPSMKFPFPKKKESALSEILAHYDPETFSMSRDGNCAVVTAATFSQLKKLHKLLSLSLQKAISLIEPERQFLLQKKWNYFDIFTINSPLRHYPLASDSERGVSVLEKILGGELGESALRKIALSNVLGIPLESVPERNWEKGELFLENSLFLFLGKVPKNAVPSASLLSGLSVGPDTIDCECCKPASLYERNVLPTSTVQVEFLADGFYFQSFFPAFAWAFHNSHAKKDARMRRKKEFCLPGFPVGPFFSRQRETIPLADAKKISREGFARIDGKSTEFHWFCMKKESLFYNAIKRSAMERKQLEEKISKIERNAFVRNGLGAFTLLNSSSSLSMLRAFAKARKSLENAALDCLEKKNSDFLGPGPAAESGQAKAGRAC